MHLDLFKYDRFSKKVYPDLVIAKAFIEDFLDVPLEEIEKLPETYRITDDASIVEFVFRCRIDGKTVIVDMQQRKEGWEEGWKKGWKIGVAKGKAESLVNLCEEGLLSPALALEKLATLKVHLSDEVYKEYLRRLTSAR